MNLTTIKINGLVIKKIYEIIKCDKIVIVSLFIVILYFFLSWSRFYLLGFFFLLLVIKCYEQVNFYILLGRYRLLVHCGESYWYISGMYRVEDRIVCGRWLVVSTMRAQKIREGVREKDKKEERDRDNITH